MPARPSHRVPLAAWLAALPLALTAACGDSVSPDAGIPDARLFDAELVDGARLDGAPPDAGPPPECQATLSYEGAAGLSVFAAGDWNGFSMTAQPMPDQGGGHYEATFPVTAGLHAYKLYVVGDSSDPWRLDPANPYRVYDGGVENSGLRVPNCLRPGLRARQTTTARPSAGAGTIDAVLDYDPRQAGALASAEGKLHSGQTERALTPGELSIAGSTVTVHVAGLADGKHRVSVTAVAAGGARSDALLLPVWIEATPFTWEDALIYMVLTDRYRDGDPSNNPAPSDASLGADWRGGDLVGVTAAIEDGTIPSLGVNALWLTPWTTNAAGTELAADDVHRVTAYHGYWPISPLDVDPRLGGSEALRQLVATAHEHGIRILMDLVVNHVHEDHPYYAEHRDWFNDGCLCGTDGCDWTEHRLDCLFRPYMPDVKWENPAAQEQFIADALTWMERYDLDGFRIDAVKHVPDSAILDLGVRVRERFEAGGTEVFLLGETAMGWDSSSAPDGGGNVANYDTISRYIGPNALTGQFDFPLYYAAGLTFLGDEVGRGMLHVDYWTRASMWRYPAEAIMTPYIGSHDTARFITLQSDPGRAWHQWEDLPGAPATDEPYDRMYVAYGWLLALPGAPLVYYGDEYGEYGGADPDNRHMCRFDGALSSREAAQRDRVSALGRARAALPGLRSRAYQPLLVTECDWVVARGQGDDVVIVALNRCAGGSTLSVPVGADVAPNGASFTDALDGATTATVSAGQIGITLPGRSVRYLAP